MSIVEDCKICGKSVTISLTPDQYIRYEMWKSGKITHIQDALPDVPADQREMFISGVCGECWNDLFGDEEEED